MKKMRFVVSGLLVLLVVLSILGWTFSVAKAQEEPEQVIQIVLVLDVSGSMETKVLSGELPAELLALLDQINRVENDADYLRLKAEREAIESDPEVVAAKKAWDDSISELDRWFAEKGYANSLNAKIEEVRNALDALGCDVYLAYAFAAASSSADFRYLFDYACPQGITSEGRQTIIDLVPYVDDPEYQELQQAMDAAFTVYDELLEASNYTELGIQIDELLEDLNYYDRLCENSMSMR
ncbi:MAG: hypothetical protein AB1345_12930 [Chloroflexota bacterium]